MWTGSASASAPDEKTRDLTPGSVPASSRHACSNSLAVKSPSSGNRRIVRGEPEPPVQRTIDQTLQTPVHGMLDPRQPSANRRGGSCTGRRKMRKVPRQYQQ